MVAIAGYYESARVALFVDFWEYAEATCLEIQAWSSGIGTHDLCDTSALLCQLSYQTIWQLVTS